MRSGRTSGQVSSFRPDAGCPGTSVPLLGVEFAECAGRQRKGSVAQARQRAVLFGGQRSQIDFLVQLADDCGGRVVRRDDPDKNARLVPGRNYANAGTSGNTAARVAPVVAGGRSFPLLTYSIDAVVVAK